MQYYNASESIEFYGKVGIRWARISELSVKLLNSCIVDYEMLCELREICKTFLIFQLLEFHEFAAETLSSLHIRYSTQEV